MSNSITAEATGDLLEINLLIKWQESQKLHHRLIQKQMKKKYLEKEKSPEQKQKIIDDLSLI